MSAGFGHDSFGGRPSRVLMRTRNLEIVGGRECDSIYAQVDLRWVIY